MLTWFKRVSPTLSIVCLALTVVFIHGAIANYAYAETATEEAIETIAFAQECVIWAIACGSATCAFGIGFALAIIEAERERKQRQS